MILFGIYTLAWVGRPLVEFLKTYGLLGPLVVIAMVLGFAALMTAGRRMGQIGLNKLSLVASVFIISQILAFVVTRTLAEAIHVVEYEMLAFCIYNSLHPRYSKRDLASITLLLILLAGWSDEAMQYFAPDRYYDLLDVALNSVSGAFGVVIASILHGARKPGP
ncbi:MAG: VanZ family protein [Nitrospinota bacterium]|nr:VanZ family protein [Nitrospinota bacterium]